jgi:hypothetical protein
LRRREPDKRGDCVFTAYVVENMVSTYGGTHGQVRNLR